MSNYSVFINGKENENWDEVIKIEIINKSGYCWTIPIEEIQTLTIKNLEENKMSEYTEPEKLSGFVVILKTYESHTVRDDNKELLDSSFGLDNIAACINLSQFNVGEGLNG